MFSEMRYYLTNIFKIVYLPSLYFVSLLGYIGLNTRSALKYPPSVGVNLSIGSIVCGVLPRSGHLINYGLSDEVIIHQDYSIACPHLQQAQVG